MDRMEKAQNMVVAWQKADTPEKFCKPLGKTRAWATQWASNMRKHGVPLKKFPKNGGFDYVKLAEVAKSVKK